MSMKAQFARLMTGCAVACVATSLLAETNPVAKDGPVDSGVPATGAKVPDASQCPVIGGTMLPASERTTAAGAMSNQGESDGCGF
jgi:hypothetical protein